MGRGIRYASEEDIEIAERFEHDAEREPTLFRQPRRRRFLREAALIRYGKVGAS